MDRLSVVVVASVGALACDPTPAHQDSSGHKPAPRVDAVLARANKRTWSDLCDVAPQTPSDFHWPPLNSAHDSRPHAQTDTNYRWVNVWASWCKPCVEELPLLARTITSWRARGHRVALTLVSVDADAQSAKQFLAARPELPPSLELQDPATAPTWLSELGLGAGTSIPVHIILDAQDKLLCVRAGGLSGHNLDQFHKLLFP